MKITNATELREAKQQRGELTKQLNNLNKTVMTVDEQRAWDTLKTEFDALDKDITDFEGLASRNAVLSEIEQRQQAASQNPNRIPAQVRQEEGLRVFRNLGEQLRAVYDAEVNHSVDERLRQLNAESRAQGNSEGVGADGGFAVQTDFAGAMLDSAISAGEILSRVDTYDISSGSNSAEWVEIDESDVSSTVYGGVQVYWQAEAKTVAASKPTLRPVKLDLQKLLGFAYATDELMQDTTFMSQLYSRAFELAIQRTLENDIFTGIGVGRPLGIYKSGALVKVAKEANQIADSLVFENIVHMWGRMLASSRKNSVWCMNPDVEEILPLLHLPVGTGGMPVFLPPSGASSSPYSTLYGRPIVPLDYCSAIGDEGDIALIDPKYYQLIRKGGTQTATSIHVAFLTSEQCFRFTFRANGHPKINKPLTIKNSTNKRSPFVTLEARA
jgi:HK97 family phage major capsid protein